MKQEGKCMKKELIYHNRHKDKERLNKYVD